VTVSVQFLWFAVVLVGFTVGFVSYWIGMDKSGRQAFYYRQLYQKERARRVLAEQRADEQNYPLSAWNNNRVSGESYSPE
jgi:hypothetical protein